MNCYDRARDVLVRVTGYIPNPDAAGYVFGALLIVTEYALRVSPRD